MIIKLNSRQEEDLLGPVGLVLSASTHPLPIPCLLPALHCSTNLPTGSYQQQMAAGAKVAARFAGMLPGLGITPDSIPVIEARFNWQLDVLQVHAGNTFVYPCKPRVGKHTAGHTSMLRFSSLTC